MTGSKIFTVVRGAFFFDMRPRRVEKKTTPAGQCRTPNFGVLQATTDTLKTLQTYSSNVGGEGGVCGRWRAAQAFILWTESVNPTD